MGWNIPVERSKIEHRANEKLSSTQQRTLQVYHGPFVWRWFTRTHWCVRLFRWFGRTVRVSEKGLPLGEFIIGSLSDVQNRVLNLFPERPVIASFRTSDVCRPFSVTDQISERDDSWLHLSGACWFYSFFHDEPIHIEKCSISSHLEIILRLFCLAFLLVCLPQLS